MRLIHQIIRLDLPQRGSIRISSLPEQMCEIESMEPKEIVVALQRSIETGDSSAIRHINANKYIQHNLGVGDGLAPILALHDLLPSDITRARPLRAIQDGSLVAVHVDYDLWGAKAGFDIHRFEDGLIVEHWDNLQECPSEPNPSGRTMFDGSLDIGDSAHTDASKALVADFVSQVMLGRDREAASYFFADDQLLQHNPALADGADNFLRHIGVGGAPGAARYDELHMLLGEGNLVLSVSEGVLGDVPTAFYDLFRVEGSHIVEHWDVVEVIPPRKDWKHENGKF